MPLLPEEPPNGYHVNLLAYGRLGDRPGSWGAFTSCKCQMQTATWVLGRFHKLQMPNADCNLKSLPTNSSSTFQYVETLAIVATWAFGCCRKPMPKAHTNSMGRPSGRSDEVVHPNCYGKEWRWEPQRGPSKFQSQASCFAGWNGREGRKNRSAALAPHRFARVSRSLTADAFLA